MDADISTIAALIGDSTRAQMLWALMGGLARPAGELAMSANVAPQTASAQLAKLLQGKLLSAEVRGRHRYHRLASPEVAVIETLATVAPRTDRAIPARCSTTRLGRQKMEEGNPLAFARTCYNHLAGTLAVQNNDELRERGVLIPTRDRQYSVTNEGRLWFNEMDIDTETLKPGPRGLARQCLDWTERRHHLAGPLGTALLQRLFELRWLARVDKTRVVRVTTKGQERLLKLLGIDFRR